MYKHWDIKEKKDYEGKTMAMSLISKEGDMFIGIKWDGCSNLIKYYNGYSAYDEFNDEVDENSDYIHICEMKEFIAQLQEVVKIAEDNFSEKVFEENWS